MAQELLKIVQARSFGRRNMNRFVFANPKLCIGCDTCLAACAEVHMAAGLQPQPRLAINRSRKISTPITCRHCENAPCIKVCPVDAIAMGKSTVVLDEAKCNGCLLCAPACPFGVITFSGVGPRNGETDQSPKVDEGRLEEISSVPDSIPSSQKKVGKVAVKCDLCDFTKQGPECVRACPTDALFLIDAKAIRKSSADR